MQLPLSWLKKFIAIKASPEEIAEKLTLSGTEVTRIIRHNAGLDKVVVGQIKRIKPHPSAEKLRLAYVDVGQREELEIVCGAPNIEVGQKVPTVLVGGRVGDLKIAKKEIRGVKSHGMLVSEYELGLSGNHDGIFILPPSAKLGEDVVKLLELDDPIFEFDLTPNRPDCFSAIGIARELAVLYGLQLKAYLSPEALAKGGSLRLAESSQSTSSIIKVEVKDKNLCPLYIVRVIRNVQIKASPQWLQNKLRQAGVRPINNVVDITNYVMLETGQPLHAFDLAKIYGRKIIVRRAGKEKILALDGKTYDLNKDILVIADAKKPIAIAGVMGGEESGVKHEAQDIVLEAAIFDPVSIRRASRALDLRSESSARFQRGLDPRAVEAASALASQLLGKLANGKAARGSAKVAFHLQAEKTVKFNLGQGAKILGREIDSGQTKSVLSRLGFKIKANGLLWELLVPSWRLTDVNEQADIVEEIGRIIDYNTLPKTLPEGKITAPEFSSSYRLRQDLRERALGWGASEILSYSFYGQDLLSASGYRAEEHIRLTNPVNEEYPYLRISLLPWMLERLSKNSSLSTGDEFKLFEIGRVFSKSGEVWQAALGLIDAKASDEILYRKLRGFLEGFLEGEVEVAKESSGVYGLKLDKESIAKIIIKKKDDAPNLRWRAAAAILLVFLEKLEKARQPAKKAFAPIPFYPSVQRDMAMIVPAAAIYKDLENFINKFDPLLKKVELFDVYHGLQGGTSLALRLEFYSTDRTLTNEEVDGIIKNLQEKLVFKFNVTFR